MAYGPPPGRWASAQTLPISSYSTLNGATSVEQSSSSGSGSTLGSSSGSGTNQGVGNGNGQDGSGMQSMVIEYVCFFYSFYSFWFFGCRFLLFSISHPLLVRP